METNPNAMLTAKAGNSIFTNVALTEDGDIWWEDMGVDAPEKAIDWKGNEWTPASEDKAAHPNSRFTVPAGQCPVIDPAWESPDGVPIDAFVFGGRRASIIPLVNEAKDWQHGVFMGSSTASEMTAAAFGAIGKLRHDPFAMLPFCGYDMAEYWQHWLDMGKVEGAKNPKMFFTNWFRKDENGKFMWPGFGENSRVLKYICDRIEGKVDAVDTPIGLMPADGAIDTDGLDLDAKVLADLLEVDLEGWKAELQGMEEYYNASGDKVPQELKDLVASMKSKLG